MTLELDVSPLPRARVSKAQNRVAEKVCWDEV